MIESSQIPELQTPYTRSSGEFIPAKTIATFQHVELGVFAGSPHTTKLESLTMQTSTNHTNHRLYYFCLCTDGNGPSLTYLKGDLIFRKGFSLIGKLPVAGFLPPGYPTVQDFDESIASIGGITANSSNFAPGSIGISASRGFLIPPVFPGPQTGLTPTVIYGKFDSLSFEGFAFAKTDSLTLQIQMFIGILSTD